MEIKKRLRHTSGIASNSTTADDIGPHILAQCANFQSTSEQKGAQTESEAVAW